MRAILTFPTFGTWLAGPSHGRLESCAGSAFFLPEPDYDTTTTRRRGTKWPTVSLSSERRKVISKDLQRIALLRQFQVEGSVIARDHLHLLLHAPVQSDEQVLRLIQLIKGALSRALTVAGGDAAPRGVAGDSVPHHKWWSRQYVWQRLADQAAVDHAKALMALHPAD